MGIWAWLILLAGSALLATLAQYTLFRQNRGSTDYDWALIAGGAIIGGFIANLWYAGIGPEVDGLHLLPALAGAVVLGVVVELVYRAFIRPHRTT
jgi:uncharacterized membrane protein YeaQ/YmgE (transglycosylase-associated protein family)